ncbi:MAG: FKBP-type peptidyl-prolyl cis-trans isomerase [Chloroflexota bacterium]
MNNKPRLISVFILVLLMSALLVACGDNTAAPSAATAPAGTATPELTKSATGLKYYDTVVGSGAQPKVGQSVSVHYSGYLTNGTKFDSSVDRGQPFKFVLGVGQVIKGWDEGVATMKVGGKRRLLIPPSLGYGAQGAGTSIPPNAELIFDVELLAVQ